MKTTTNFQLVSTDKLIPYVNNARTHSPEQIKKLRSSLREFGFVNPVIIDREYNVIAGHGRLMAAKEEGYRNFGFDTKFLDAAYEISCIVGSQDEVLGDHEFTKDLLDNQRFRIIEGGGHSGATLPLVEYFSEVIK